MSGTFNNRQSTALADYPQFTYNMSFRVNNV